MALRTAPAVEPVSRTTTTVTRTADGAREVTTSEVFTYSVSDLLAALGISMDPDTHSASFGMREGGRRATSGAPGKADLVTVRINPREPS